MKLNKKIGCIGGLFLFILVLLIDKIIWEQQRQYYKISDDLTITVWHRYIIFDRYTSFFSPKNSDIDYIKIEDFYSIDCYYNHITLFFIDHKNFAFYTTSASDIRFSLQKYCLKGMYYRPNDQQYYDWLKLQQEKIQQEPYCQIQFYVDMATYLPCIDIVSDTVINRTAYYYEYGKLFNRGIDSTISQIPIKVWIECVDEEITREESYMPYRK